MIVCAKKVAWQNKKAEQKQKTLKSSPIICSCNFHTHHPAWWCNWKCIPVCNSFYVLNYVLRMHDSYIPVTSLTFIFIWYFYLHCLCWCRCRCLCVCVCVSVVWPNKNKQTNKRIHFYSLSFSSSAKLGITLKPKGKRMWTRKKILQILI